MGYYTRYKLTHVAGAEASLRGYLEGEACMSFDCLAGNEPCKWYDHDEDIKRAMLHSGATCVVLHGEGEENTDVWDKEYIRDNDGVQVRVRRYTLTPGEWESK